MYIKNAVSLERRNSIPGHTDKGGLCVRESESDGMVGGTTELLLLALNNMVPGVSYRKQQDRCVLLVVIDKHGRLR